MPGTLLKNLKQTITHWVATPDGYGGFTYATPVTEVVAINKHVTSRDSPATTGLRLHHRHPRLSFPIGRAAIGFPSDWQAANLACVVRASSVRRLPAGPATPVRESGRS